MKVWAQFTYNGGRPRLHRVSAGFVERVQRVALERGLDVEVVVLSVAP